VLVDVTGTVNLMTNGERMRRLAPFTRDTSATVSLTSAATRCHVCGAGDFGHRDVLWDELVLAWKLSQEEAHYINVQQGTHCLGCGSTVRSIALARAMLCSRSLDGTLTQFVSDPTHANLRVLEVNEAGTLHPFLARLKGHTLVSYPDFDITQLALPSEAYDLVIHSDTLEHVPDPQRALEECCRVLAAGGCLIFTIPMILGRLTRDRRGLEPSFHGSVGCRDAQMLVYTEFGADAWSLVLRSGFSRCEFVSFMFPSGIAIIARK
jgi:SAM-dependent methyltransferase